MILDEKINEFLTKKGLNIYNFYGSKSGKYVFNPYYYYDSERAIYIEIYDFDEMFNMMEIEKRIKYMEEKMNTLLKEKQYVDIFSLMEKGLRLNYLNIWYFDIPEDQRLEVFDLAYSSSEYNFDIDEDILDDIKKLAKSRLQNFDDEVIIYRGETEKSTHYIEAYSWTLDLATAKFFATRFNSKGKIYTAKIKKKDIINYITDRNEEEILLNSDDLINVKLYKEF